MTYRLRLLLYLLLFVVLCCLLLGLSSHCSRLGRPLLGGLSPALLLQPPAHVDQVR